MGRLWTPGEQMFLVEHYPWRSAAWCAEQLGRSEAAVRTAAMKLGLELSQRKAAARRATRKAHAAPARTGALAGGALAQALGVTGRAAA